jgi:hypothetical protein
MTAALAFLALSVAPGDEPPRPEIALAWRIAAEAEDDEAGLDARYRGVARSWAGLLFAQGGDPVNARAAWDSARRAILADLNSPSTSREYSLRRIAVRQRQHGAHAEALATLAMARALASEIADAGERSTALEAIAAEQHRAGDDAAARATRAEALALLDATPDGHLPRVRTIQRATLHAKTGDFAEALALADAYGPADDPDDRHPDGTRDEIRAAILEAALREPPEVARAVVEHVRPLVLEASESPKRSELLVRLAECLARLDQVEDAEAAARAIDEAASPPYGRFHKSRALRAIASALARAGRREDALRLLGAVRQLADGADDSQYRTLILNHVALEYAALGEADAAHAAVAALPDGARATLLRDLSDRWREAGDAEAARTALAEARAELDARVAAPGGGIEERGRAVHVRLARNRADGSRATLAGVQVRLGALDEATALRDADPEFSQAIAQEIARGLAVARPIDEALRWAGSLDPSPTRLNALLAMAAALVERHDRDNPP